MYNKKYFIEKFTAIPDDRWCTGNFVNFDGQCCAAGFCGDRNRIDSPPEAKALYALILPIGHVADINDGFHGAFQQPTPKLRILAALASLPD